MILKIPWQNGTIWSLKPAAILKRAWVNGDLVNEGFNMTAKKGRIAIQAEKSEVEIRKFELTDMKEYCQNSLK